MARVEPPVLLALMVMMVPRARQGRLALRVQPGRKEQQALRAQPVLALRGPLELPACRVLPGLEPPGQLVLLVRLVQLVRQAPLEPQGPLVLRGPPELRG